MTIKAKLLLSIISLVGLLAVSVVATSYVLSNQEDAGLVINLTGRQRMLSQRMAKEALLAERSHRAEDVAQLGKTVSLFNNTLNALRHGGQTADGSGHSVDLAAVTDRDALAALAEGASIWEPIHHELKLVLSGSEKPNSKHAVEAMEGVQVKSVALLKLMNKATVALQKAAERGNTNLTIIQYGMLGLSVGLGIFVWRMIRRKLIRPLTQLIEQCEAVRGGDLRTRLNWGGRDELGKVGVAFDDVAGTLGSMISEVVSTSDEVAQAAGDITQAADEVAKASDAQAKQTGQVASAIEQMVGTVSEIASQTTEATNLAERAGEQAKEGGKIVGGTVEGIDSVAGIVNTTATSVRELGERSKQIGKVIEVINDIADQTNLLALNAAIEAARAGEHGRGFAVVADEVRKLAERTTKATEEVSSSIQGIQQDTDVAVMQMEAGTTEVAESVDRASKAGEALQSIEGASDSVLGSIRAIATAAEEQSATSAHIQQSVTEITQLSSDSAKSSTHAASVASQLEGKSKQLRELVDRFTV